MLSITPLKSAAQAGTYYEKDNYYTKNSPEIKDSSQWWGKGAEILQLSGKVDFETFKSLLGGTLPDGTQLGWDKEKMALFNAANPDQQRSAHRPGYDLTFSAPKSVSLVALIGNDSRVLKAHELAVDKALGYIEQQAAQTRLSHQGKIFFAKTDNLVVARFQHDLSRALDPDLHTHCVVLNMTESTKGWRSLSSEQLFDHKMSAGSLYRSHLAYELQKLGYGITKLHADGRFEIKGMPEEVLRRFSKRREMIEKALEESGREGPIASADIALRTRHSKQRIDREELKQHWKVEEGLSQFNVENFVGNTLAQPLMEPSQELTSDIAEKAVSFAIAHLSQFESTLNHQKLSLLSLREAIGRWISPTHIQQAIENKIATGQLLIREEEKKEYTTPALLKAEKSLLNYFSNAPDCSPISRIHFFSERLIEKNHLSLTQAELARLILQSHHPYIIASHFKAELDLTAIKPIARFAENRGYTVRFFSLSQQSAEWLASHTGMTTKTLSHLLAIPTKTFKTFQNRQLWFIHKAEQFSTQEQLALAERANIAKARVVFLKSEVPAFSLEAGNAPRLFEKADLPTVVLRDSTLTRQVKTASHQTQRLVTHLLSQLQEQNKVIASSDIEQRYHYIREQVSEKPHLPIIAFNTEFRKQLNQVIRETHKTNGHLHLEDRTFYIREKMSLSQAEKEQPRFYHLQQQCQFRESFYRLGIKKEVIYTITEIKGNSLFLTDLRGHTIEWDPSRHQGAAHVNVYELQPRSCAIGERLRMTTSHPQKAWISGDILTVTHLKGYKATLKTESGKKINLHLGKSSGQHWDHAYTISPHHIPESKDHLLVYLEAKQFNLASHRALLSAFHQSKEIPLIITDNIQQLQEKLSSYIPSKTLATDHTFKEKLSTPFTPSRTLEFFQMEYARDAVECAMNILSEREAVFYKHELITKVNAIGVGYTSPDYMMQAIKAFEEKSELIAVDDNRYTTLSSLEQEQTTVNWVLESTKQLSAIYEPTQLKALLAPLTITDLNPEQKIAVLDTLTTSDQLIGIQGHPGTGKTRLLQWIKHFADKANIPIQGIAPSASAAEQIFTKSGIQSGTLERYLIEAQKTTLESPVQKPLLLIVDESSMTSTRQMVALKEATCDRPIHLVIQGDIKQLPAIEAGKPFALLQLAGMKTVKLTNIQRQLDPVLRQMVYDSRHKTTLSRAWANLAPHIHEAPEKSIEGSYQHILKAYKELSPVERQNTLVITGSNTDRNILNRGIRTLLEEEGVLFEKKIDTTILVNRDLTLKEKTSVFHFEKGNIIRFNGENKRLGITAGSYWQVQSRDTDANQLILKNAEGKSIIWSPHTQAGNRGFAEVYYQQTREVKEGEWIRWRRNDFDRGIINAQTARVTAVDDKSMSVLLKNGHSQTIALNQQENQHWDYAYSSTVHLAQGDDAPRVLVLMNSAYIKLQSLRSFHTILSRAQLIIQLFTDDIKKVQKAIAKNDGYKTSSLQATSKSQTLQNAPTPEPNTPGTFHNTSSTHKTPEYQWDAATVNSALTTQVETVAIQLLGEPKQRMGNTWKFGSKKGSLHIEINGEKQGAWFDFQTHKGGTMLQLIQYIDDCNFKQALEKGAQLARLTPNSPIPSPPAPSQKLKTSPIDLTEKQKYMRQYAARLFEAAAPIEKTLGETYLKTHRQIEGPYSQANIKFHPAVKHLQEGKFFPAVLFAARNEKGQIHAIQAVFLDQITGAKAAIEPPKKTFGPLQGAAVTVQKGTLPRIEAYAEGPETALSVAAAFPNLTVKASLGISQMLKIEPSKTASRILIFADNDGAGSISEKTLQAVQEHLKSQNKEVHIIHPPTGTKDFNDLLKQEGVKAIQKLIEPTLLKESPAMKQNMQEKQPVLSFSNEQSISRTVDQSLHV